MFEVIAFDDEIAAPDDPGPQTTVTDPRWTMSLNALRDRASRSIGRQADSKEAKRTVYERSGDLKIYVLRRADGICEGCSGPAPFLTKAGRPYLEPHHTRRLSDGGPDDYHHVIALCPTCHRRVHYGKDGGSFNDDLRHRLTMIETA